MCLTFNNSAKSSSNSTIRGSFEILMTSRFQNCPWVSDLMEKKGKNDCCKVNNQYCINNWAEALIVSEGKIDAKQYVTDFLVAGI